MLYVSRTFYSCTIFGDQGKRRVDKVKPFDLIWMPAICSHRRCSKLYFESVRDPHAFPYR